MVGTPAGEVPWFRIERFLQPDQYDTTLGWCRLQESVMQAGYVSPPGQAGGEDHQYRRARVCFDLGPVWGLMEAKLLTLRPFIATQLQIQPWVPSHLERQITLHSEGEYFREHNDTGLEGDASWSRVVSWVYYLNDGYYSGGELKLGSEMVPPVDNSLIVFPSSAWHQVCTVHGSGKRWTINGWDHRVVEAREIVSENFRPIS